MILRPDPYKQCDASIISDSERVASRDEVGNYLQTAVSSLLDNVSGAFSPILQNSDKKKWKSKTAAMHKREQGTGSPEEPSSHRKLDPSTHEIVQTHDGSSPNSPVGRYKSALKSPMAASPLNRSNLRSPLDKRSEIKTKSMKIRFMEDEADKSPISSAKTEKPVAESTAHKDQKDRFVIQAGKQKNRKSKKDAIIEASLTIAEEEIHPVEIEFKCPTYTRSKSSSSISYQPGLAKESAHDWLALRVGLAGKNDVNEESIARWIVAQHSERNLMVIASNS
eukprot:759109-Hanusia_phi.AAC.4